MNEAEYILLGIIKQCNRIQEESTNILRFGMVNYHPKDATETPNIIKLQRNKLKIDTLFAELSNLLFSNEKIENPEKIKISFWKRFKYSMKISKELGLLQ